MGGQVGCLLRAARGVAWVGWRARGDRIALGLVVQREAGCRVVPRAGAVSWLRCSWAGGMMGFRLGVWAQAAVLEGVQRRGC